MNLDLDHDAALRLFEAAFEQDAIGMAVRDADPREARLLRVNNKLCEILGYRRDELLQLSSIDLSLPEERDDSVARNARMQRGDVSSYSREKRYLRKDGTVVWTNIWLSAVLGADGKPAQVIMMIEDISERKRAQAVLLEAETASAAWWTARPLALP